MKLKFELKPVIFNSQKNLGDGSCGRLVAFVYMYDICADTCKLSKGCSGSLIDIDTYLRDTLIGDSNRAGYHAYWIHHLCPIFNLQRSQIMFSVVYVSA